MSRSSYQAWAASQCVCRGTGFVEVLNDFSATTYRNTPIKNEFVTVVCACAKGDWINEHNQNKRLVYNPSTMTTHEQVMKERIENEAKKTAFGTKAEGV